MISYSNLTLILMAYMLGSVPSAVWVGKMLYGIDVRDYGSGNAGATNTFRVLGKKAGLPVLIMDILKGFLAVKMVWLTGKYLPDTQQFINLELSLGIASLLGHIFPIFAGFRGGKGVATLIRNTLRRTYRSRVDMHWRSLSSPCSSHNTYPSVP
jgi:glycerol-3-phosphate acyltransferase PlsY